MYYAPQMTWNKFDSMEGSSERERERTGMQRIREKGNEEGNAEKQTSNTRQVLLTKTHKSCEVLSLKKSSCSAHFDNMHEVNSMQV